MGFVLAKLRLQCLEQVWQRREESQPRGAAAHTGTGRGWDVWIGFISSISQTGTARQGRSMENILLQS